MPEELNIKDILPNNWFSAKGEADIYVSVYHCLSDYLKETGKPYVVGEIFYSKYLLINTSLEYDKIDLFFKEIINDIPQFVSNINTIKTEQNVLLLFFLPYTSATEADTIQKLQSARGLLSITEGKNTNYWHVTDYILNFPSLQRSSISGSIRMPVAKKAFYKEIIVDEVSKRVENLEEKISNQIRLASRWIDSAEHETQPIDEFLKLWFAIEVVSMPDTTNIRPLADRMAKIYDITSNEAKENFYLGRLFGLRSNIVHEGLQPVIHMQLTSFLRAIFYDLLMDTCNLPSKHLSKAVLNDNIYPLNIWML